MAWSRPPLTLTGADPVDSSTHLRPSYSGMFHRLISNLVMIYSESVMSRTVIDIDREALEAARAELGTKTVKDTVNEALRRVAAERERRQLNALEQYPGEPADDFLMWRRSRDERLGQ